MIANILAHTPLYVWALLAFLLYRGMAAMRDRESSLFKLALLPVAMLLLTLSGMDGHTALGEGVWAVWASAALSGAILTWKALGDGAYVANRAVGTIFQRGSKVPLMLMIAIFSSKYAVGVFSAMHADAHQSLLFMGVTTCLFGLFNGVFLGRLARCLAAWSRQPAVAA